MDLLLKKLEVPPMQEACPVQALDSHMTCEVYGNTGHSGNSCLETNPEEASFINSEGNFSVYQPQQASWNSRPNLPFPGQGTSDSQQFSKNSSFDQKAVNDSISKKFFVIDKILESLCLQMEGLNSAMKNQLSFNKMLETQIAQLASAMPNPNAGKLPGQPEPPVKENINAITTRGGKSTQDPPHPEVAGKQKETAPAQDQERETDAEVQPPPREERPRSAPHEFYDTIALPFPQCQRKATGDEQFGKM
jgi:hypothetical protein